MKKPLEIVLSTIHVGSARRVVTLGLGGKDMADEFLTSLARSNRRGYESLRVRVQVVAEIEHHENEHTFRHLGDGLYEFKGAGVRLYAFYDEIPGLAPQLIIATHGGSKNNKKQQQADIARARSRKAEYEQAKAAPGVIIRLQTLSDEN